MFVDRSSFGGTPAYIEAVQPLHERLQQILTQAAGYSLLVMTRRLAFLDTPVVDARAALASVSAALDGVRVPPRARAHHDHTRAAAAALGQALDLLTTCLRPSADDAAREALSRTLRGATDHLRAGTGLLPGFALVDFSQACCAAHAGRRTPICDASEG